jgi:CRISPR-associated protein Cas2
MSLVIIEITLAPERLRGALQRRMLEVRSGFFVADLTKRIQEEIWAEIIGNVRAGSAILVTPANTEAGYTIRTHGADRREVISLDNFPLVKYQKNWSK